MMKKCNKIERGAKPWQAKRKKKKGRWREGGRVQGEREYPRGGFPYGVDGDARRKF